LFTCEQILKVQLQFMNLNISLPCLYIHKLILTVCDQTHAACLACPYKIDVLLKRPHMLCILTSFRVLTPQVSYHSSVPSITKVIFFIVLAVCLPLLNSYVLMFPNGSVALDILWTEEIAGKIFLSCLVLKKYQRIANIFQKEDAFFLNFWQLQQPILAVVVCFYLNYSVTVTCEQIAGT
jgi:hypothetical protein